MVDSHDILGPSGSSETGELVKALAKAQAAMKAVEYDSKNPHFKSKFSSLSQCVEGLKKPLTDNGLAIPDFRPGIVAGEWVCIGTLRHGPSGQWISGIAPLLMAKKDMQQFGAAMTYAKRTLLMALTGAVSGEHDDDGNSVSTTEKPAESKEDNRRHADKAIKTMSYEALALKAIEGADDAESAKQALDTVELRTREGAVDRAVFARCKERFSQKWSKEVTA